MAITPAFKLSVGDWRTSFKDMMIPGITSICQSQNVCFTGIRDSIDWSILAELANSNKYPEIGKYVIDLCSAKLEGMSDGNV